MNVLGSNGFCACCLLIGTPACLPNERIGVAGAASSKSGLSAFRPGRAILTSRRVEITGPEPSHGFGSAMWDAGFVNHRVMASSKKTSLLTLFTMKSGVPGHCHLASDLAHIGTFTAAFIAISGTGMHWHRSKEGRRD